MNIGETIFVQIISLFHISYCLAKRMVKVDDLLAYKIPNNSYKLAKMPRSLTFSNEKARREFGWEPLDVLGNYKV